MKSFKITQCYRTEPIKNRLGGEFIQRDFTGEQKSFLAQNISPDNLLFYHFLFFWMYILTINIVNGSVLRCWGRGEKKAVSLEGGGGAHWLQNISSHTLLVGSSNFKSLPLEYWLCYFIILTSWHVRPHIPKRKKRQISIWNKMWQWQRQNGRR